ncbi:putative propionyl-CoA carboxylase beta chain [Tepidanaerobacter acetatoxydans Re1]|uniref:Putative propionyl-CoA carboxylase beta chain n=3 Tax=Tepidanaerobacter acetatoxydans TaxID=499229 RepID=F4LUC5_TEPAE|nr:carboxyl transferase domain-containing protein [Tepidanaerobacter acetatoxydans]AEE91455.1 Propionyl-CoA carboxylase [Tepidanaerobacter acetatoxydans Re1]CCP26161.1 putative propionyl-CoA carboxylase beta chain [Tepidanaerobacter acetatoxydans Re1]
METIETKIKILEQKRKTIEMGGGEKRIQKQHESGKLTARERIEKLLDKDSFIEIDAFVEHRSIQFGMQETKVPSEGVITGYGTIDGRLVFIFAQDFTTIGGSLGEMHAAKICKVMDMAAKMGAPFIGLNDSGGARIQEGVDALKGFGDIFYRNTLSSGVIPQLSVILGPCAGGAVYSPALTDFVFMVSGISKMFITGPQVIKAVTGEEVSDEELGGAAAHNQKSGVAHFISQNEQECFDQIKKLLSYIPSNNLEDPPYKPTTDNPTRTVPELDSIVPADPNKPYDIKDVINHIVDDGDFFEVQPLYAPNLIIGFARLSGHSVGILANQPKHLAGCLDINASDKAARFIRFCDAFNIPLVTFTDTPGYLPGVNQEHGGIIRHGAKLLYAYSEATVPKLTVITRKAYGGAYIAMCSRHLGADQVFAWPTAEIAVMGPDGAANIIFKKEIEASEDPINTRKQKIEEYRDNLANPYQAAARGYIDDIIVPSTTRAKLTSALEMLMSKSEKRPAKKHGNIPV